MLILPSFESTARISGQAPKSVQEERKSPTPRHTGGAKRGNKARFRCCELSKSKLTQSRSFDLHHLGLEP